MKKILFISSSISGDKGHSVQLAQQFIAQLPAGTFKLDVLDLNATPVPHLEMAEIAAWMTPAELTRISIRPSRLTVSSTALLASALVIPACSETAEMRSFLFMPWEPPDFC